MQVPIQAPQMVQRSAVMTLPGWATLAIKPDNPNDLQRLLDLAKVAGIPAGCVEIDRGWSEESDESESASEEEEEEEPQPAPVAQKPEPKRKPMRAAVNKPEPRRKPKPEPKRKPMCRRNMSQ